MNLKEIKETIITCQDSNELYRIEIELQEYIGELYKEKRSPNSLPNFISSSSQKDETEIKSEIELASLLQNICRDRLPNLKNENIRFNHKFMIAAKVLLPEKEFEKIEKAAIMPRQNFKEKYGVKK